MINVSRFDADTMEPYDAESASLVGLPWDPEPGTMGAADLSDGTLAKLDRDDLERVTKKLGIATSSSQSDDDLRAAITALRDKNSQSVAAGEGDGGGGAAEPPSVEDPAADSKGEDSGDGAADEPAPDAGPDLSDAVLDELNRDGLKAIAEEIGLEIDGRSSEDAFRQAIKAHRDT